MFNKKQQGVALIQVLLITSVLLVLVIQISLNAKSQIEIATQLNNRSELLVDIESVTERLQFEFLTEKDYQQSRVTYDGFNYFGKAFNHEGLQIIIQDEAGLVLLLYYPDVVKQVLLSHGLGESEASNAINTLKSWHGMSEEPRNLGRGGPMQYPLEIDLINEIPRTIDWINLSSYLPLGYFNIVHSPTELFQLLFNKESDTLVNKRDAGDIQRNDFIGLTGQFTTDSVTYLPSDIIRVSVEGRRGKVALKRSYKVKLQPDYSEPLVKLGY